MSEVEQPVSKKQQHRKDKPWDVEGIDKWKIEEFTPNDIKGPFLETSSFSILFPKYKEAYLKEYWPQVTAALLKHGIASQLDLVQGSMTVETTPKTYDPYILFKARDLLKLLARSVPFAQAQKILEDDMQCDIVKIGNITRSKEKFLKRRQRLLGPNGNTLKAIELLTECYIMVQGNTVSCMGPYKGLKEARKIILDCMSNIHPIYHIKSLMIKRELMKDEKLKNENWDRFLPSFKKKNIKKKTVVVKKKRELFPPAQTPRKIDLQIESGEYFLSKKDKDLNQLKEKKEKSALKSAEKQQSLQEAFVAPKEVSVKKKNVEKEDLDLDKLKEKFKAKGSKRKRDEASFIQ